MKVGTQFRSAGLRVLPPVLLAAHLLTWSAAPAQTMDGADQTPTSPYLEPLPEAGENEKGPAVTFRVTTEIELPGPLPGPGPRLVEGQVITPVAGGMASCGWAENSQVSVVAVIEEAASDLDAEEPGWTLSPDGRIRVAALRSGHMLAQKRCKRCKAGWRKKWKLRLGGVVDAPPLVTDDRVFFGALDNRVYSVKRKNGHRVWELDIEGRPSRSLARWQGAVVDEDATQAQPWEGEPLDVVLVIPNHGREIVALDATTGTKVASYSLSEDTGLLIGAPLLTPDGKIVVARQKYAPEDASLMVFDLVKPAHSAAPAGADI